MGGRITRSRESADASKAQAQATTAESTSRS